MAPNTAELAKRAQAHEETLSKLIDGTDVSVFNLAHLIQEYRTSAEELIFADFEYAAAHDVESKLWAIHLRINTRFRKELKVLRRTPKDKVVEIRKFNKHYLYFIKASQKFYRQYILSLDAQFDGIPELRKIAHKWKDEASKAPLRQHISSELQQQILLSCHQTLIQLGDLSRYRETELVEKDRNWGPAKGYYDLAAEIYPDSGQSHNQLAVIAREDGNHFRSTYHLYRSLASKYPHPMAKQNLDVEFKKIVAAWTKGELINNHKSQDGNTAGRALVAWFIRLHSKLSRGQEFVQHEELESEVLSHLAIELKERSLDSILQKIILINMSAEYYTTVQMASSNPPENSLRTYFYYFRLNVKTFFTLLQIFQSELERLSEADDVTQNGDRAPQLSDKVTAVARRVLPGLRLYSTWLLRNWRVLNPDIAAPDTLTNVEVQELWKAYAATLTLLASSFPAGNLPEDKYMLEEDIETIGFQPLMNPDTIKVWYDGANLKPKATEINRNHPNVEMLMRVRDFMIDGLELTQLPEAPLDLDGLRFLYREAGVPSELLASPNNRPDGSPAMAAEPMDFPLFPQEAPIAEDQKSYSIAAPSESASTTLAKDPAMNRMVDDLVGFDDGLDPLVEEDENIPPTPPAQTFDDTTVLADNSFAPAQLSISDLVNAVQNYKKPLGSPAPVAPLLATPMNRIASSSSIRGPANLPSLPDGQYSGASIWNRNYDGTPGPSSPLLDNTNGARGSPLNANRVSGHLRGDSSASYNSSDWTMSNGTPVQRPVSGGLGSGAAWGNPATSGYGAIYGTHANNHNTYAQATNATDVGLMSPLLFGKGSSWNSGFERGHSSYGRTSPNGQAG
ncbi:hypothetical protein BDV96DRAFT_314686 [Lophiotrema nucula]|uniref:Telomerase activating protein Est1 n=1 Tax=Lophiotrema nucula TaxID=690887 RepID=A0A6A5ZP03_9PLEO|nr:hypothetical protein BDV96DRAFT_314686 [Lophiotrema nucula]